MAEAETYVPDEPPRGIPAGLAAAEVPVGAPPPPATAPTAAPDLAGLARPPDGLMGSLADLQRRKVATEAGIEGQTDRRMEEDRAIAKRYMAAEGVGPDMLKPWDAATEHRKYETSPLEAFGSYASVFAIIASAFTHAPLTNALNGSAAAMTAIREGDEKNYQRSYQAWKDNMELAQKRFNMQHTLYNDAIGLMSHDANAGRIKLENAARRFGDQKTLALMEAGYDKEVFENLNAQTKLASQTFEMSQKITDTTFRKTIMDNMIKTGGPNGTEITDPIQRMRIFNLTQGVHTPVDSQLMTEYLAQPNPDGSAKTPEQGMEYAERLRKSRSGANSGIHLKADFVNKRFPELMREYPGMTETQARLQAEQEHAEETRRSSPADDRRQDIYDKYLAEWKEKNPGKEPDTKVLAAANDKAYGRGGITANRKDELVGYLRRAENFELTVDKVEGLLTRHGFLTGLGGKVLRGEEAIENALGGSKSTDWKQFERWVSELKEWAPRILNETRGRPLASEAAQVNSIIAGLSLGDTTANTVRAYRELKPLIAKIKQDLESRIDGEPRATVPSTVPPMGGGGTKEPWKPPAYDRPKPNTLGPRSEIDAPESAA